MSREAIVNYHHTREYDVAIAFILMSIRFHVSGV